jgi:GNAT superfamily N-acetyltransferase
MERVAGVGHEPGTARVPAWGSPAITLVGSLAPNMSPATVAGRPRRPTGRSGRSPQHVTLRRVRASDVPAVLRQREGLLRDMGDIPVEDLHRYLPRFRRWFLHELRSRRLWGFLAVTRTGRAVGGGLLWLQPRPPSPRFRQHVGPYVFSVYTEPAYRGQGIASRVVAELVRTADDLGFARVELHTTEAGRGIYERLGFVPTTQLRLTLDGAPHRSPRRRVRRTPPSR